MYTKFLISLSALLFLCWVSGCSRASKNATLSRLEALRTLKVQENTKAIIFISDKSCAPCSRVFTKTIERKISDERYIFIISAESNFLDLTAFTNKKNKNILIDENKILYYDDSLKNSFIMLLRSRTVDTLIYVDPATISQQVDYLNSIL